MPVLGRQHPSTNFPAAVASTRSVRIIPSVGRPIRSLRQGARVYRSKSRTQRRAVPVGESAPVTSRHRVRAPRQLQRQLRHPTTAPAKPLPSISTPNRNSSPSSNIWSNHRLQCSSSVQVHGWGHLCTPAPARVDACDAVPVGRIHPGPSLRHRRAELQSHC